MTTTIEPMFTVDEPSHAELVAMYQSMRLIRDFEERVHELFLDGELPGFLHLCSGQEASAVGVITHLGRTDAITSTHRNHGHALAKGASPTALMIELFGRAGGSNDGKGGSMHLADASVGHLASGGIVGASAPLALGPAQAAKLDGRTDVAVAFFGDGGAQQGTVLESMNLAAVWSLPVIFVCENNLFGQATPVDYASSTPPAARALGFGIPSETVDGQDVIAVRRAAGVAIARARSGAGPTYLEIKTYSYHGAWEGEPKRAHRLPHVERDFRHRDPLEAMCALLRGSMPAADSVIRDVDDEVTQAVDLAVETARRAPLPNVETAFDGVYADSLARADREGLSVY